MELIVTMKGIYKHTLQEGLAQLLCFCVWDVSELNTKNVSLGSVREML